MIPVDPQQVAAESTEILLMHFPLMPFCARMTTQDTDTQLQTPIPDVMNIRLNCVMDIRQDLLLDFSEKIPHITSRFHN